MNPIFVDTGAWDAIADRKDRNHEAALGVRDDIARSVRLVTTNYVLDELFTLLLMNVGYTATLAFKQQLDALIEEQVLLVVWIDVEVAEEAWIIFERFNTDKRWSFTDCTSYVVAKRLGISEVFAFDHHFEQMGFVRRP